MHTWTGLQPHWLQLVSSLVSFPRPYRTTSFKNVQDDTALASSNYLYQLSLKSVLNYSAAASACTQGSLV